MVKNWINMEQPRLIPWTPLTKPLSECTVAMLSSGGIAMAGDVPFDQQGERDNPWWGDPSYRRLPSEASAEDVHFYHLHVDVSDAQKDLNCLLPLQRLSELAEAGEISQAAPRHYSIMGYNPQPHLLLEETVPQIVADLRADGVDALLLFPA
jgi:D-proline reductase (dithiol) PrdB